MTDGGKGTIRGNMPQYGAQQPAPQHSAPLHQRVPSAQHWQPQHDQQGRPLLSLPVTMDNPAQIESIANALHEQGLHPQLRESKSMGGMVLYVAGDEAVQLGGQIGINEPRQWQQNSLNTPPQQQPQQARQSNPLFDKLLEDYKPAPNIAHVSGGRDGWQSSPNTPDMPQQQAARNTGHSR